MYQQFKQIFPKSIKSFAHLIKWLSREKAFANFLQRCTIPLVSQKPKGECWCVVQPWMLTAVPWFIIAFAFGLNQRGWNVLLVWDDTSFGPDSMVKRVVQGSIGRILNGVPKGIPIVRLSELPLAEDGFLSKEKIDRLSELNTVWRYKCEVPPSSSASYSMAVNKSLKLTDRHIKRLVEKTLPQVVLVPGGVYGSSGLFMELSKSGILTSSFDSGPGILMVCTDGIAAQCQDLPKALRMLPADDDWVVLEAQSELERRRKGSATLSFCNDTSVYQIAGATDKVDPFGILLPLNQSFDSAALGKHRVFKNQTEWMLETVEWSLKNSDLPIVVRRHPGERVKEYASLDDYQAVLKNHFGKNYNIKYVSENDRINTYDLIDSSKVVAPYTSTTGVEAAAMGKPVVTESSSYYADLGFVWGAKSRDEYFNLLKLGLEGKLVVSETQRQSAWRCYYLAQCCNFVYTPFTPMPEDFDKWVRMNPVELFSLPEVADVLDAIDTHVPTAIIRHNRRKQQYQAKNTPISER